MVKVKTRSNMESSPFGTLELGNILATLLMLIIPTSVQHRIIKEVVFKLKAVFFVSSSLQSSKTLKNATILQTPGMCFVGRSSGEAQTEVTLASIKTLLNASVSCVGVGISLQS